MEPCAWGKKLKLRVFREERVDRAAEPGRAQGIAHMKAWHFGHLRNLPRCFVFCFYTIMLHSRNLIALSGQCGPIYYKMLTSKPPSDRTNWSKSLHCTAEVLGRKLQLVPHEPQRPWQKHSVEANRTLDTLPRPFETTEIGSSRLRSPFDRRSVLLAFLGVFVAARVVCLRRRSYKINVS